MTRHRENRFREERDRGGGLVQGAESAQRPMDEVFFESAGVSVEDGSLRGRLDRTEQDGVDP
jgi:hypothetical protein